MADAKFVLSKIKLYNNHPRPGQPFADIFPIFRDPVATEVVVSHLTTHIISTHSIADLSAIVCLEARGFFFAPLIATRLGLPCVPVRKKGKLPGEVVGVEYEKDYGADAFEMKSDAFEGIDPKRKKVILVDDLLGKGGSVMAAKELVEKLGMEVAEAVFIFDVEVPGYTEAVREKVKGLKRYAMITLTPDNMPAAVN